MGSNELRQTRFSALMQLHLTSNHKVFKGTEEAVNDAALKTDMDKKDLAKEIILNWKLKITED